MSPDHQTKAKHLFPSSTMLKIDSNPKTPPTFLTKLPKSNYFLKIDFFFYINKNLVTNIIKPNAGQSLLL